MSKKYIVAYHKFVNFYGKPKEFYIPSYDLNKPGSRSFSNKNLHEVEGREITEEEYKKLEPDDRTHVIVREVKDESVIDVDSDEKAEEKYFEEDCNKVINEEKEIKQ